jgi:murein DD-endopeptidase MepM/ murein hydrolase activator NlpD
MILFSLECLTLKTRKAAHAFDNADNEAKRTFFYHIRKKNFLTDKINISDKLLEVIVTSFPSQIFEPDQTNIEKYLFLNRSLREKSHATIQKLCESPSEERLWDGTWLRMKNAATMAKFADRRIYYYGGNIVDRASHLGIDLASLANSPVQAANTGKVIFAQDLYIYGQTVIIDHGQGLYTLYGHLSDISAAVGQTVTKGDIIGTTGTTGLSMGDHLHFGFLIHGVPVNPIEWWDSHWIKDNIYKKLDERNK